MELTDREQIEQLLARYAELIDAGDFDGLGELLGAAVITMEDGTVVAAGREQIRALYEATTKRHDDGTPHTHHVITNVVVEPQSASFGTSARLEVRSRFTVFQATDGVPLQAIVAGRYRDVVERDGHGDWHFVERCMVPVLVGDVHAHLTIDPSALG